MLRAFIFDIYNTLLEVKPAQADAELRWSELCRGLPAGSPVLSLRHFNATCQLRISEEHARARLRGVQFPEVYWPDIARAVFPALVPLSEKALDDFLYQHVQLERPVSLMPGATELLPQLRRRGSVLGLCANCQPYTLRELDRTFGSATLSTQLFDPQLCFFSFRAGFSKPDPGALKLILDRLAERAISPAQTLVVGHRLDNDMQPARALGCRTWHLSVRPALANGGDWYRLQEYIRQDASQ